MNDNTQSHPNDETEGQTVVDRVVARFGGLTATARALGVPIPTVQGWTRRKQFPAKRLPRLLKVGALLDPPLTANDLIETTAED